MQTWRWADIHWLLMQALLRLEMYSPVVDDGLNKGFSFGNGAPRLAHEFSNNSVQDTLVRHRPLDCDGTDFFMKNGNILMIIRSFTISFVKRTDSSRYLVLRPEVACMRWLRARDFACMTYRAVVQQMCGCLHRRLLVA